MEKKINKYISIHIMNYLNYFDDYYMNLIDDDHHEKNLFNKIKLTGDAKIKFDKFIIKTSYIEYLLNNTDNKYLTIEEIELKNKKIKQLHNVHDIIPTKILIS